MALKLETPTKPETTGFTNLLLIMTKNTNKYYRDNEVQILAQSSQRNKRERERERERERGGGGEGGELN